MAINLRDSYSKVTWDLGSKKMKAEPWGKTDDTGRGIIVTLAQNSVIVTPTTETLRMSFVKPDGTDGYIPATLEGGKYYIENMSQVFAVPGKVYAELELDDGTEFIKSITFVIEVYESQQSSQIVSSNDYTALQAEVLKINSFASQLAETVAKADAASLKADAMASGSPKGVYATLTALQSAKPTGDTGAYLVTADGKWYYWSGTAWTVGGTYQSTGIGTKTVPITGFTDEVKSFQYPFQEKATLLVADKPESVLALRDGIFDIKLYGANPLKNYSIASIKRKVGLVSSIDIWDSDSYGTVASFYAENYVEPSGVDTVSLVAMNGSGITAKVMIDWSKFPNPCNYTSLIFENCGISKKCYINKITDSEINANIAAFNSTLTNNQIFLNIKDARIYNAKSGHVYGISTLKRNNANVWQIDIWDFTDSKYVCSFYRTGYVEPSGVDSIVLATLADSITATMNVQWDKIPVGNNTTVTPIYIKNPVDQAINARRWESLKWYADGDSITEQNNYPYFLNIYCKFASYYNAGQSGKGMVNMTEKFAVEPLTNYDLITVFAGTNDYGGNTPLGTIADTKDTASFYGYVKKVIYTVLTAKPSIKLAFFTPMQRGVFTGQPTYPAPNSLGFTLDQYVDAIIAVCKMYAIPCLDLFRVSGVNEFTLSTMTTDNLHLNNTIGGQSVAKVIQGFIETL